MNRGNRVNLEQKKSYECHGIAAEDNDFCVYVSAEWSLLLSMSIAKSIWILMEKWFQIDFSGH